MLRFRLRAPARAPFRPLAPAAALAAALAACADPATAPRATRTGPTLANVPAASCDAAPVQALTVTPATSPTAPLSVAVGQSATFTACTQYATAFTLSGGDPAVATVTPGPAGRAADGLPYAQTFTVTAVGPGTTTITVSDKKGNTQTVTVTVPVPAPSGVLTFDPPSTPAAPLTITRNLAGGGPSATITVSEAFYTGTFTITGCRTDATANGGGCSPYGSSGQFCDSGFDGQASGYFYMTDGRTITSLIIFGGNPTPRTWSCTFTVADGLGNTAEYPVTYVVQ